MSTEYQGTIVPPKTLFSLPASVFAFSMAALFLYVLGGEVSNDAAQYEIIWHWLQDVDLWGTRLVERYEIGFLLLYWGLSQVLSTGATFYAVGLSALSVKYYLLKKYLHHPVFALFIYISIFVPAHESNQIREAVATCFVLYALIGSKRGKWYLILGAIASLFHYIGLIIIFLYFVRAPLIGLAFIVLLSFIWNSLINSTGLASVQLFLSDATGQRNLTNSVFIMQLCISLVCAFQWKALTFAQKKGAYLLMMGAVFYIAFADNAPVAHRIRELSVLGIFPLLFLGQRKLTDAFLIMWLCVGYIVLYTWWLVLNEILEVYSVI